MSPRVAAAVAYGVVGVAWGSTYTAIRVGVEHVPPAILGSVRFLIAGAALLAWALARGHRLPATATQWKTNAVAGILLLTTANGLVIWAEQYIESGVAAVFVVSAALWIAIFDAVLPGSRSRPTASQFAGLMAGFGGVVLLVGGDLETLRNTDWRGPVALAVATAFWGLGTIISQRRTTHTSALVSSALQMLFGGSGLLVAATVGGEWSRLEPSWQGAGAVLYLILIGSILGFTAYVYMLRYLSAAVAGTYAYVNALVAVALGWLLLDEPVTLRTLAAMVVVIGAVIWVRATRRRSTAHHKSFGKTAATGAHA